jgi:hypothetical protein
MTTEEITDSYYDVADQNKPSRFEANHFIHWQQKEFNFKKTKELLLF